MKNGERCFAWVLLAVICLLWPQTGFAQEAVGKRIDQLNATLQNQGMLWTAGRTSMSDLSPEQRRALLGGPMEPLRLLAPTHDVLEEREDIPDDYTGGAPPASWDWRNYGGVNWMTPVTDQMCGDCWAHATCGSMEVRLRWQQGGANGYELPINLSERYAVTCSPHGSCSPWNIPGLLSFIQSSGVSDEECLPYNAALTCADRCSNWNVRLFTVTSYGTYDGPSDTYRTNVMNSCYLNGPIPVWMMVYSDFWDYSGGIYVKSAGATEEGGHFVNIVGWGVSGTTPYWICKNSWGTGWGVGGYFFIRRGTNESRIEEQAYWITPQALPNLDDSTPAGWDYPIVPRGDNTATAANCQVPATLTGNSNSTYWNVNWINEGTVLARDNVAYLTVDGDYWYWFSISFQPSGYETKHLNYGPQLVRGGRHTLCFDTLDYDNRVWEYDESDNTWCRQFVWSPYSLTDNSPVTRASPPKKDSLGYSWYNSDGFSFLVQAVHPDAWWSAVGVLPSNASADYDVRLHDIGTYTGAEAGFGSYLQWSTYGGSASDFVIVNDNLAAAGTYYAGAINYNEGTGDYRIEEDASEKIYLRPGTQWNGLYSKTTTNVLDIYEIYLNAGTYYFLLDQTAGTCDLGMTLYDDETVTATKANYMAGGYANSTGDGGDEAFQITIPDSGFHGLVVWKGDASDYDKACSYRIAAGPPAITVTTPNGGETLYIGSSYNLTWDSFGIGIGSYVMIEISRDGGANWSTIIGSTANDGSHPWTAAAPLSTQCRIRVTSTSDSSFTDVSDANFNIADVCECDLNKDGKCNILDYQLFIQDWGRTNCGTPPGTGLPPNDCECDLNKDGKLELC